jgi:hypothetical protein
MDIPFKRLKLSFSPLAHALKQEAETITDDCWVPHVNSKDYTGAWDTLALRCRREHVASHPILQCHDIEAAGTWVDTPLLGRLPNLQKVVTRLACPQRSVRLMRLRPGALIKPHRDHGVCLSHGQARLHLPLTTSDKVVFQISEARLEARVGDVWYINADLIHSVRNDSDKDRIHLVIDCVVNHWLYEQLGMVPSCIGADTAVQ